MVAAYFLAAVLGPLTGDTIRSENFEDLAEQIADGLKNQVNWQENAFKESHKWDGQESNAKGPLLPPYSTTVRQMWQQRQRNAERPMAVNHKQWLHGGVPGEFAHPTLRSFKWMRRKSESQMRTEEGTRSGLIPVRGLRSKWEDKE